MDGKVCASCKQFKILSEYWIQANGKPVSWCIQCRKAQSRNPEYREKNRKYSLEWVKRNPEKRAESNREWRRRNVLAARAHCQVYDGIRNGELTKNPCECCGSSEVHAHHDDYSKPLEVRWLCVLCHEKFHHPMEANTCKS